MKRLIWIAALTLLGSSAGAATPDEAMAKAGCLACHSMDKKILGPAYKDVAAKYKARKDAEAYVTKKIREGSTGVWGAIPMPPNGAVNADEAKTLAKYILSVK